VAGFLLDAARSDVSARTVTQVLAHWAGEGVTSAELLAAIEIARASGTGKHDAAIDRFEQSIRNGLRLE
jgi:hypothetical protein